MAKYVQEGHAIDWTASKAVEAGEAVIFGARVGIADRALAQGEKGVLHMAGVFELDTEATITAGAEVFLKDGKVLSATTSGAVKAGYAVAASTGGKVLVAINA